MPHGHKWCPDCDQIKALSEFAFTRARKSGVHSYCLVCHANRGVETKNRLHGGTREYHLRRRYGIGDAEVREIFRSQGGVCAICGTPDPEHVDHDHATGVVRGLLCFNCNGGLGQFKDDTARMRRAIDYLEGRDQWRWILVQPGVYQRTLQVSPR